MAGTMTEGKTVKILEMQGDGCLHCIIATIIQERAKMMGEFDPTRVIIDLMQVVAEIIGSRSDPAWRKDIVANVVADLPKDVEQAVEFFAKNVADEAPPAHKRH